MTTRATRDRIQQTALDAFCDQGFAGTSIRDLALRLNMTSAALYYHFPSKAALLDSLVAPYLDDLEALLDRFPPSDTVTSIDKRSLLAAYLDLVMRNQQVADLVGKDPELPAHPDVGPRMIAAANGMVDRLAAPTPTDEVARLRSTAAIGALRRPILRPEIDASHLVEDLLDSVMAALEG